MSKGQKARDEAKRWATVVLIVIVIFLSWEVHVLQNSVSSLQSSSSRTEHSSTEAADAATQAKQILQDAIEQSKGSTVNQDAVVQALRAIGRIEVAVCGGPCPEVPK
jgi:3-dehydroquinate synthase class II